MTYRMSSAAILPTVPCGVFAVTSDLHVFAGWDHYIRWPGHVDHLSIICRGDMGTDLGGPPGPTPYIVISSSFHSFLYIVVVRRALAVEQMFGGG